MTTYLTVEFAPAYGVSLQTARRLTDEEKARYLPEFQDHMMIRTGNYVELPNVTWIDLAGVIGARQIDGEFPGCSNRVYIITQEQWDALLAVEGGYAEQSRAAEIAELEADKAAAERQMVDGNLPAADEVKAKRRNWINTQNEGGEGYVPNWYSKEQYDRICARLSELKREMISC